MSTLSPRKSPMSEAVEKEYSEPFVAIRKPLAPRAPEGDQAAPAGAQASEIQPEPEAIEIPSHWPKGALLNVRNRGDHYCITLYPEEFDPRSPERAMMFPNSWTCQDFVSRWYSRETADPRAR